MNTILLIEDDLMIGEMLSMYLTEEGYSVTRTETALAGFEFALSLKPDLIILDQWLPDRTGIELCGEIRNEMITPILMISMDMEVRLRIEALQTGADDYVCKPFSMREFAARVAALLRRSMFAQRVIEPANSQEVSTEDPIMIDHERRTVYLHGNPVTTTFTEFEILRLMLSNKSKVFSREELIYALRGYDSFITERAIDVHVAKLRKKLEDKPNDSKYIKTVWGVGYKFCPDGE
ncbi:response regulator transcription factor [Brevibacillus fortis]|uniref:response regulator transcription factor n=1 Tax=Brevibacillus fortis TaxID=2126352 RepID=UPI002E1BE856|nr:response regulator transcription factor [Brevibacillus fortis]